MPRILGFILTTLISQVLIGSQTEGTTILFDGETAKKKFHYQGWMRLSAPKINSEFLVEVEHGKILKVIDCPNQWVSIETFIQSNVRLKPTETGIFRIQVRMNSYGFWVFRLPNPQAQSPVSMALTPRSSRTQPARPAILSLVPVFLVSV